MLEAVLSWLLDAVFCACVWLAGGDIEAINALFEILDAEEWP